MALRFDQLVTALADAVIEAQHHVRQAHIGELWSYFKDGAPISVELQIPRFNMTTGKPEPVKISVPLITLVNPSQLSIQQMQTTMQVDMSEITGPAPEGGTPPVPATLSHEWGPPKYTPLIAVSTTSTKQPGQVGIAQVTLTIAAEEPSEGLARLLNHLNKCL